MEERKETLAERQEDVKDFAELLQGLTTEEKREIRGIMIGLQLSRGPETEKTA